MARNPTRIGRYDLISALATGGMGRIYLGRAAGIGGFERKVVIKTLEVPVSAESDPAIAMFLDEARLLGLLHHQHIASVYEVGRDDDGRHYMVLDYVEGFSAHDVYERATELGAALPLDFTLTVVSAAANGLHYAHTRKGTDGTPLGIVHRDVTPSNVMIGHDGAVKLIDFGIAMATDRQTKTQTGFVKGKVGYLSPEQVGGRDVDPRTDVFALGIVLYELSTLQRAFRDNSDLATMQRIKQAKFVRPSQLVSEYPPELEAIVVKALQVDPRDRYQDADAMRRAIEALGHRLHFVLGDAAVIEVMSQLAEAPAEGARPAVRKSDPSFEWNDFDHDLTVRRDPQELLAAMRAEAAAVDKENKRARRKLRAATETVDALIVGHDPFATPPAPLPLASPPPTPHVPSVVTPRPTTPKPKPVTPQAMAAQPAPPQTARSMPAQSPTARSVPAQSPTARTMAAQSDQRVIGASLVQAHARKLPILWIAIVVAACVAAGVLAYLVTREAQAPLAGSTAVPRPPPGTSAPAAARASAVTPAPLKPMRAPDPAPPAPAAAPSKVRVQIVTHPADAWVFLDGRRIGRTPLDQTITADRDKHVIKLRRRGYTQHRLDVTLDADITKELTLARERR